MAMAMLDIALAAAPSLEKYFIVAEDHGFIPESPRNGVEIKFYPYAQKKEALWSAVLRLPPDEVMSKLFEVIPSSENQYKYTTNILLGLPVKEFSGEKPQFTYKYRDLAAAKFPELTQWQAAFLGYLKKLIAEAVTQR